MNKFLFMALTAWMIIGKTSYAEAYEPIDQSLYLHCSQMGQQAVLVPTYSCRHSYFGY